MPVIGNNALGIFEDVEITYNGVTLPPMTNAKITIHPQYDKSGRVRKYDQVTMICDFFVPRTSPSQVSTDLDIETIQRRLNENGQVLVIKNHGFGNLISNRIDGHSDFMHGPKTLTLEVEPMNSNKLVHVVWIVEFTVPPCTNANNPISGQIIGMSYGITWGWSDNDGGLLTRTINGEIELESNRPSTSDVRALSTVYNVAASVKNAHYFLNNFFPRVPGFKRTRDYDLSMDRKVLQFTINDEEIMSDVAFPEPILDIKADEHLHSERDKTAFQTWDVSLSAQVTVFKPRSDKKQYSLSWNKRLAWIAVGRILLDRVNRFRNLEYYRGDKREAVTIMIEEIDIGEDIFGNSFDVGIKYLVYGSSEIIFAATGFFNAPRTIGNWQKRDTFLYSIGADEPSFTVVPDNEVIIDLCNNPSYTYQLPQVSDKFTPPTDVFVEDEVPDADKSWRKYTNDIYIREANQTTVNVPLQNNAPRIEELKPNKSPLEGVFPLSEKKNLGASPGVSGKVTVFNSTGKVFYVTMYGKAERLGYKIKPPNLLSVGGMVAVKCDVDSIVPEVILGGKDRRGRDRSMYKVSWVKHYVLVSPENDPNLREPKDDSFITDQEVERELNRG